MSIGDHVVGYTTALVLGIAIGVTAMDIVRDVRAADEAKKEAKPQSRIEPAPIFSKRCMRRGQTYNARQADGGEWVIGCYGPRGTRA